MIKDKIRQIKYLRMKPEERFVYEIFSNLECYVFDNRPESFFYKHNGLLIFDLNVKTCIFWCDHKTYWNILTYKYNISYDDVIILTKKMLKQYITEKDVNIRLVKDYSGINIIDNRFKQIDFNMVSIHSLPKSIMEDDYNGKYDVDI